MSAWKRPPRKRVERIKNILRSYYGRPVNHPHRAPIDELVLTVLSQNTNDRNRDVAFNRLRERFDGWEAVADATVAEVEEAIKPGGISKVKSKRIQEILRKIREDAGDLDISWLETVRRERAIEFLESLPGVGRKTAACVLLFSYDRPEMPVDTHVYRVSSRLGLIRPKASFEQAHDEMAEARARRRALRAAHQHAAPRPAHLRLAAPALRGLPAQTPLPARQAGAGRAQGGEGESESEAEAEAEADRIEAQTGETQARWTASLTS